MRGGEGRLQGVTDRDTGLILSRVPLDWPRADFEIFITLEGTDVRVLNFLAIGD